MSLNFFRKHNTLKGVRIACEYDDYFGQIVGTTALGWTRVNLWDHVLGEWRVMNVQPARIIGNAEIRVQ